jgi:hypothetical protein
MPSVLEKSLPDKEAFCFSGFLPRLGEGDNLAIMQVIANVAYQRDLP